MISVAIIDDEKLIRDGLVKTVNWESMGFHVVGVAGNGEEGIRVIREKSPNVVFTDIMMPLATGIDVLKTVRQETPKTRVVVLSGYDEFSYAQQALKYGAFDYLLKPVNAQNMEDIMRRLKKDIYDEIGDKIDDLDAQRLIAVDLQKYIGALCIGDVSAALKHLDTMRGNDIAKNINRPQYADVYLKIVHSVISYLRSENIQIDRESYDRYISMSMDLFSMTDEEQIRRHMEEFTDQMIQLLARKKTDNYNAIIQMAVKYVDAHYRENLSVQTVSEYVFLSPNYFSHVFRKVTGERFTDYLNRLRIRQASAMLSQGKLRVYEVAEMVGYNDYKYFSSVFKKITGSSPTGYINSYTTSTGGDSQGDL